MKRLRLKEPTQKGSNGDRDPATGRFLPGHGIPGPGNPYATQTAKLRKALMDAITPADIKAIIRKMIQKARAGDVIAGKLVLDRMFGKPAQSLTLEIDPSMEGFSPDERFL